MTAALTMPLIRQAGFSVLSVPIPVPSFPDKTPGSRIRYSFPKNFYLAQPDHSKSTAGLAAGCPEMDRWPSPVTKSRAL